MDALSWISDFVYTISKVFPRLELIPTTHKGVIFTRSHARAVGAGLHIYWPVWSEMMTYPVKRQTMDLRSQTLTTSDRKPVVVVTTVVFEIVDIYKALVDTYDLEDTICDVAQGAVKRVVMSNNFDDLHKKSKQIDAHLTKEVKTALETYGIKVTCAFLTDFSTTIVIRCVQS